MTYSTNLPLHDLRTWLEMVVEAVERGDAETAGKYARAALRRVDVLASGEQA